MATSSADSHSSAGPAAAKLYSVPSLAIPARRSSANANAGSFLRDAANVDAFPLISYGHGTQVRLRKFSVPGPSLGPGAASASASASASVIAVNPAVNPAVNTAANPAVNTPAAASSHSPHSPPRKASLATIAMPMPPQPQPPPDPNRYATEDFNFSAKRTWSDEKERIITGPYDYLDAHPGKDFRSELIKAFDAWLEVPPDSLAVITRVIGMLHTASLLVDDVEDNSLLRRGFPVAHVIFGVPQTINSSNYVYFLALQEVQKLKNPRALAIFADELKNLHRGQGMDLYWRDTLTCPTEDDYLEMVGNKTGGLFRLGIKLMQAESRSLSDCVPLCNMVGLAFQIADDYRNLWSQQYTDNKGMCEDLTEGKFSFPVIHAVRSDPDNLQLLNILRQRTDNEEVKRYAVQYMEACGSFEYTRQVLAVLLARARRMTDELDAGRGRAAGVHSILDKFDDVMKPAKS